MRLKRPHSLLCFCVLVQVSLAHPKNDYFKSSQRTNPKKYYPTSTAKPALDGGSVSGKLRHSSSRFKQFEKIKTKIDSLASDSSSLFGTKNSDISKSYRSDSRWDYYSDTGHRMRHHGWSNRARTTTTTTTPSPDEELFNNYGTLDDDDQMEDDDPDDIFQDSDYDFDEDFQAEEPTSTERPTPAPKGLSSFGQYKWDQLGTRERVEQARKNYMQRKDSGSGDIKKSSEVSKTTDAVANHFILIKNSGQCKRPIPKVIPVHSEHPDPTVTYIPHCTMLHRCAEDTGCCNYDTTCQFKDRVEVSLYFYVKPIGSDVSKVERLKFYNHTECECREKLSNTTERQIKRAAAKSVRVPKFKTFPEVDSRALTKSNNAPESLLEKCKCPKEFIPKIKFGAKCHCDCDNTNEDCVRMKKGKEYNSLMDRMCIQNRECGTIACEYGPYNKLIGRCPRYDES